jgi:hypothetical protein
MLHRKMPRTTELEVDVRLTRSPPEDELEEILSWTVHKALDFRRVMDRPSFVGC